MTEEQKKFMYPNRAKLGMTREQFYEYRYNIWSMFLAQLLEEGPHFGYVDYEQDKETAKSNAEYYYKHLSKFKTVKTPHEMLIEKAKHIHEVKTLKKEWNGMMDFHKKMYPDKYPVE